MENNSYNIGDKVIFFDRYSKLDTGFYIGKKVTGLTIEKCIVKEVNILEPYIKDGKYAKDQLDKVINGTNTGKLEYTNLGESVKLKKHTDKYFNKLAKLWFEYNNSYLLNKYFENDKLKLMEKLKDFDLWGFKVLKMDHRQQYFADIASFFFIAIVNIFFFDIISFFRIYRRRNKVISGIASHKSTLKNSTLARMWTYTHPKPEGKEFNQFYQDLIDKYEKELSEINIALSTSSRHSFMLVIAIIGLIFSVYFNIKLYNSKDVQFDLLNSKIKSIQLQVDNYNQDRSVKYKQ